jgi:hypothetical protein
MPADRGRFDVDSKNFTAGVVKGIRFFLAVVFISYGVVKLMGGQFYYGDWSIDKKTVSGTFMVWAFYGYSSFYGHFIGLFELIPGILLLFRRTATLGAAALFAVGLNITVMDFAFGFPSVKYMCLIYTILCGLLLFYDRRTLMLIFWDRDDALDLADQVAARRAANPMAKKPRSKLAIAAFTLVGIPLIVFALNLIGTSNDSGLEDKAADFLVQKGWSKDSFRFVGSRYTGLFGINRTADLRFSSLDANRPKDIHVLAHRASGFTGWKIQRVVDPSQ